MQGADLVEDSAWIMSLHVGVKTGSEEQVEKLLSEGVNPDEMDWNSNGEPALLLAVKKGFAKIVRLLLAANCDVNARNSLGETALHIAVQRKYFNLDIVEFLLEHSELNPNVQDNFYGYAPLHVLVKTIVSNDITDHNTDAALKVAAMLAIAGDVNIRSHRGDTPLHRTVSESREQLDLVKLLLDSGADANIQNECGETALTCAVVKGHYHSAQLLLDHGANPNVCDKYGQTGLHHAAMRNEPDLISLLLQYNCYVNKGDLYGNTALHLAAQKGYTDAVQAILSNSKVDVNALDVNGKSALLKASEGGFMEVVQQLLQAEEFHNELVPLCNKDVALAVISNDYVKKWHPEIYRLIKCVVNSVSCSADL